MPLISVITPTIRKDGLDLVKKSLERQSLRDFEWIIGSPFDPEIKDAIWVKDDFVGGVWTVNRIYNKMISQAKADLLVSWQDYTFSKYDTLQRFFEHFQVHPNFFIGAVGNKYLSVFPDMGALVWKDPRENDKHGSFYPCFFNDIEWNLCSVPTSAVFDIGGFDEDLDFTGYGMDGYSVNERANMTGKYDFHLDQSIKSYSLEHDRPKDWDLKNNLNGPYEEARKRYTESGHVLSFLRR